MKRARNGLSRKLSISILVPALAFLIYFPGQQTLIAITLATGIGIKTLQANVDGIESKAVTGEELSRQEIKFLRNLYTCFEKGGRLTVVLRQSSQMMHRYLSLSGKDLKTSPRIFIHSAPVHTEMQKIRDRVQQDIHEGVLSDSYSSDLFYMGDPAFFDSFVGLYFGHITADIRKDGNEQVVLTWKAECPWEWPSYKSLHDKYGDYHAQCFPLPNAASLLFGSQHCLWIDDGLGGHLENLNIAKSFLVWAEWNENMNIETNERMDYSKLKRSTSFSPRQQDEGRPPLKAQFSARCIIPAQHT